MIRAHSQSVELELSLSLEGRLEEVQQLLQQAKGKMTSEALADFAAGLVEELIVEPFQNATFLLGLFAQIRALACDRAIKILKSKIQSHLKEISEKPERIAEATLLRTFLVLENGPEIKEEGAFFYKEAKKAISDRDFEEAIDYAHQMLARDASDHRAYELLGQVYYGMAREENTDEEDRDSSIAWSYIDSSVRNYLLAISLSPAPQVALYVGLAQSWMDMEENKKAMVCLTEAAVLDRDLANPDLLVQQAFCHLKLNNLRSVTYLAAQALEHVNRLEEEVLWKLWRCFMALEDEENALLCLEAIIASQKDGTLVDKHHLGQLYRYTAATVIANTQIRESIFSQRN